MLNFSSLFYGCRRRWLYGLFSVVIAISIGLTNAQVARAVSWFELLIRGTQILQLATMSNQQEVQLGQQINQQLIDSGQAKLYRDRNINKYINDIGQLLAKHSDRPEIPYTFQVVDDKSINAFATMGGFVYVNTGLILKADNESELASVIGHEIGHIVGRHSIKQMRETAIAQGLLSSAGLDTSQAVQIGVELALTRRNSRQDELEADRFGLENLREAGYAPVGMLGFMQKLLEAGGSTPSFLSTHPATSERIKLLEKKIDATTANSGKGLDPQDYQRKIRQL
ncbi:Peptidase family M48 [Xenococcus sp. PCC 7305]|uniref:M48 family metallopeptidase n=1 Tax=Xenococcus sp. PCC 7305 TaxID=102125 RepID=UPI0002ACFA15|nr:M48 family metallopeptidase [Xenococcus sp. PCC 7305]ELS03958.1 Peptidase family M48 [Xenococcus sp. PCC 7305]